MTMPSLSKKVICFDLDDTLYKEKDFVKSAFKEVATYVACMFHVEAEKVYNLMLSSFEKGEQAFQKVNEILDTNIPMEIFLKMYREHKPDIRLKQNVLSTLTTLKEKGFILGLITDGRSITQRNKIESLGLERFFLNENIIISEEFGSEKPSENNYKYFMKKYPSVQYAYIGDNLKKDFVAPNRLEWISICLLDNGENIHEQKFTMEKQYQPSFIVKKMEDIVAVLS